MSAVDALKENEQPFLNSFEPKLLYAVMAKRRFAHNGRHWKRLTYARQMGDAKMMRCGEKRVP